MNDLNPEDFDSEVIKFFAAIYTYFSVQRTENPEVLAQYSLMAFTVTIWLISFTNLIVASLVYLPLLSKIRGNLKVCQYPDTHFSISGILLPQD